MNGFWNALGGLNEIVALPGIHAALVAGYSGAVLAVIALVVNLLFRRWLTATQMLLLWGLVLVRMALPIAPDSQASVHNVLRWLASEQATDAAAREHVPHVPALEPATAALRTADATPTKVSALVTAEQATTSELVDDWIPHVWLLGAMIVFGWTLGTHWRFTRRIARVPVCGDERLLALWQRCREELGVRREIPVVVCDEVSQPAVMGAWRAMLLLPPHCVGLTDDPLRLVMLHELTHVRCWDVAVNWLLVLVRAAQWWNPFFWLSQSRFVNLREQSRDAMVLRHLQGEGGSGRAYADLLLSLAGRGAGQGWRVMLPASLLGFISSWFRKRSVANRLRAMSSATRVQRRGHRAVVAVTMLVIGLIGLTDADEPKPETEPVYSDAWKRIPDRTGEPYFSVRSDAPRPGGPNMNEASGPWSEQDYDVTPGAAIIMRQTGSDADELAQRLEWDLVFLADPGRVTGSAADVAATAAEPLPHDREDTNEQAGKVVPEESAGRPHVELCREGERWVIRATGPKSMHERISQTVHAWNRSGRGQVSIETRIATTRQNVLDAIQLDSVSFRAGTVGNQAGFASDKKAAETLRVEQDASTVAVSAVEHHIPVLTSVLTDEQTRQFVQAAQGSSRSNAMLAPKVAMFNGQQARVFSGSSRPFVVGFTDKHDGGFEPQIRLVDEGFDLTLHPELTEGQDGVDLAAKLDLCELKDVQEFSTRVDGKDVTVQVPSVGHTRVRMTARLKDNQTLLLCIPPTYDQKHYAWVLLTARVIADEP